PCPPPPARPPATPAASPRPSHRCVATSSVAPAPTRSASVWTAVSGRRARKARPRSASTTRRSIAAIRVLQTIEEQHEWGWKRLAAMLRRVRSEEHTSELQSPYDLVCRLLLEKKKQQT